MVRIITDSAADFSAAELNRMNIHCIPITVIFDETEYLESVDLDKDTFYELLLGSETLPKTAQPSPQYLIDQFEDAHANGEEAIYISLSSGLSGTWQSAVMTQDLLGYETCHVFDSRSATGGQRLLVEYAVRLRDQGKNAGQILAALEDLRGRVRIYACMATMENLFKGGRISHTTYKLGTLANIKPLIAVDTDGRVQVPVKAMGMRKGMDMMCRHPLNGLDGAHPLYVMYTNNRSAAEELEKKLIAAGIPVAGYAQVGAAIGSHIGPDACGLVYAAPRS